MSKRKLLSANATKKRDVLIGGTTVPPLPENVGALTVSADTSAVVLWCANARSLKRTGNLLDVQDPEAQRQHTLCFWRGIKETITIRTGNPAAWRWRRIVFSWKGPLPIAGSYGDYSYMPITTGNRERLQRSAVALPFPMVADLYAFLFRGLGINNASVVPQDWIDPVTAPVDTENVRIMYDKVHRITSGNEVGIVNTYRMWHPINKYIKYADQEVGGELSTSPFSVGSRVGLGDVYIVDIIVSNSGASEDFLDWLPTTTCYWHEK